MAPLPRTSGSWSAILACPSPQLRSHLQTFLALPGGLSTEMAQGSGRRSHAPLAEALPAAAPGRLPICPDRDRQLAQQRRLPQILAHRLEVRPNPLSPAMRAMKRCSYSGSYGTLMNAVLAGKRG